jgi:hypothetical protein
MVIRIHGLAETVLSAHDKTMLATYQELVCRLPAKDFGTMEFDMSPQRTLAIMQAGEAAMEAFLGRDRKSPSALSEPRPAPV